MRQYCHRSRTRPLKRAIALQIKALFEVMISFFSPIHSIDLCVCVICWTKYASDCTNTLKELSQQKVMHSFNETWTVH